MGISTEIPINTDDFFDTLRRCGAYYECPLDANGKRLGPLVGYAKKYDLSNGEKRQMVGEQYLNFAKAEELPHLIDWVASKLANLVKDQIGEVDYVLAAPMGGVLLGSSLAKYLDCRFVYVEKKITALATAALREQSEYSFLRHTVKPHSRVLLIEDVVNNFSNSSEVIELVEKQGASVVGIACAHSWATIPSYPYNGRDIPLVFLTKDVIRQWRQDDPAVKEDIEKGNVVLKPKNSWESLFETEDERRKTKGS